MWLYLLQMVKNLGEGLLNEPLPRPWGLLAYDTFTRIEPSSREGREWAYTFLLSSWITNEKTLFREGKRSSRRTWFFTTENWSLRPVRNWIIWSSTLYSLLALIGAHLHWIGQVQLGRGRWEWSSSHKAFNSVKYSKTNIEPCLRLLMEERKFSILIRSTFEKRSLRSCQTSNTISWKTTVCAIESETEAISQDCTRWLHVSHAVLLRSSSSGLEQGEIHWWKEDFS